MSVISVESVLNTRLIGIFFWGRSGSLFMQSLLDSHPQILTANGSHGGGLIYFHLFTWTELLKIKNIDEQIDYFCHKYHQEQSLNLDHYLFSYDFPLDRFKLSLKNILEGFKDKGYDISRKIFFLAVHYAYASALKQVLSQKSFIVYQMHSPEVLDNINLVLEDFPDMRVIGMVREPLRSFNSLLAYQRFAAIRGYGHSQILVPDPDYGFEDLVAEGIYSYYYRHMLKGWSQIESLFSSPIYVQKLESLHINPRKSILEISQYIGLDWDDCLTESTIDGQDFTLDSGVHGEKAVQSFDIDRTMYDGWQEQIDCLDRFVFQGLMYRMINRNKYAHISLLQRFLSLFLICIPTKIERKSIFKAFKNFEPKCIKGIFMAYFDRVYASGLKSLGLPIAGHYLVRYQKLSLLDSLRQYFKD